MTKLTKKSGLTLGSMEKTLMSELKDNLQKGNNEKRTTIYLESNIFLETKKYCVMNNITIKNYINNLIRKDLQEKGII